MTHGLFQVELQLFFFAKITTKTPSNSLTIQQSNNVSSVASAKGDQQSKDPTIQQRVLRSFSEGGSTIQQSNNLI
jgi:hypothetical protein